MRPIKGLFPAAVLVLLGTCSPAGVLKADVNFYAETVFSSTFGILDATTGAFTAISTQDPAVAGLAVVNGTLYGTDYENTGQLYSINPGTGAFTAVGAATGISYYDFGSTTTGLFALSTGQELYSINPITGAATDIGATGLTLAGASQLSNNGGALYAIENGGFYTVNTTSGSASFVANNFGPYDALGFYGATLYGAGGLPGTVDTIDTTTGASTTGPTISGTGSDAAIFGIAAVSTPEPGAIVTLGLALAGLSSALRLKKTKVTV